LFFYQAIHNKLAEHKHSIESVNRNGGQFIREAKVSENIFAPNLAAWLSAWFLSLGIASLPCFFIVPFGFVWET
jgi:hypothetical protein